MQNYPPMLVIILTTGTPWPDPQHNNSDERIGADNAQREVDAVGDAAVCEPAGCQTAECQTPVYETAVCEARQNNTAIDGYVTLYEDEHAATRHGIAVAALNAFDADIERIEHGADRKAQTGSAT